MNCIFLEQICSTSTAKKTWPPQFNRKILFIMKIVCVFLLRFSTKKIYKQQPKKKYNIISFCIILSPLFRWTFSTSHQYWFLYCRKKIITYFLGNFFFTSDFFVAAAQRFVVVAATASTSKCDKKKILWREADHN